MRQFERIRIPPQDTEITANLSTLSCLSQSFVIEVKTKGASKYLIYRRYREFFRLHQNLDAKYSPEDPDRPSPNSCVLPSLPGQCDNGSGVASGFTSVALEIFLRGPPASQTLHPTVSDPAHSESQLDVKILRLVSVLCSCSN